MDERLGMGRIQGAGHLATDRQCTRWLKGALRAQELPQIRPSDEAHRKVEATVDLPCVMNRYDVWMLKRHRELGLPGEALAEALIERELRRDKLERHGSFQPEVARAINDAHAATADQLLDPVAEEIGSKLKLGPATHPPTSLSTIRPLRGTCQTFVVSRAGSVFASAEAMLRVG
jgi:hypothetical protein